LTLCKLGTGGISVSVSALENRGGVDVGRIIGSEIDMEGTSLGDESLSFEKSFINPLRLCFNDLGAGPSPSPLLVLRFPALRARRLVAEPFFCSGVDTGGDAKEAGIAGVIFGGVAKLLEVGEYWAFEFCCTRTRA